MKTLPTEAPAQFVTLSKRFHFSRQQVADGIIIAEASQNAKEMARALELQESFGPLAKAKDLMVIDTEGNLVFVGLVAIPHELTAYTAVYFYSAGWFDCQES